MDKEEGELHGIYRFSLPIGFIAYAKNRCNIQKSKSEFFVIIGMIKLSVSLRIKLCDAV